MSRRSALSGQDLLGFIEDASPGLSPASAMNRVLSRCRALSGCEAGAVFLLRRTSFRNHGVLEPLCLQNDRIRLRRRDFSIPVDSRTIAGHVARTGMTLNIPDVHGLPKGGGYEFDASFEHPRYRTKSMLAFPLLDRSGRISGVVELINHKSGDRLTPFPASAEAMCGIFAKIGGLVLERVLAAERARRQTRRLRESRERMRELAAETEAAMMTTVNLLSRAAEIHDEGTGNHIIRVNEYGFELARLAGAPEKICDEIRCFAQLHDVGKMSIDVAILRKRGPLDSSELEQMRCHTLYGYQILAGTPRLRIGAEIARWHHERWDGSGYPDGLKGEEIPLHARITALADIYDALRSERSYKKGFSHERAVRIITGGDDRIDPSSHFDPRLLFLFVEHHEIFREIWDRLQDV